MLDMPKERALFLSLRTLCVCVSACFLHLRINKIKRELCCVSCISFRMLLGAGHLIDHQQRNAYGTNLHYIEIAN